VELAELDYQLPSELIAQEPSAERTDARLLVVDRTSGEVTHEGVRALPRLLRPGDLLVLNDTRVVPARVVGHRPTGGRVELLILQEARASSGVWEALVRGSPRVGEAVVLPGGTGRWVADRGGGRWIVELAVGASVPAWLDRPRTGSATRRS
jgi:S-adenosylmethionine:tRNA ribosyltransferase-isomerase